MEPVGVNVTVPEVLYVRTIASGTINEGDTLNNAIAVWSNSSGSITISVTGDGLDPNPYTYVAPALGLVTPILVSLPFQEDNIAQGDRTVTVTVNASSSTLTAPPTSFSVNITDDDVAGVIVTETGGSTAVTERGASDSYAVVLTSQPTANVTLNVDGDTQLGLNPQQVVFTPANWNIPQTVTVSAVDNAVSDGSRTRTITHTATSSDSVYNGINISSVITNITDDEPTPALTIGDVTVNEGDGTATFTVSLDVASSKEITVDFETVNDTALDSGDYTGKTGTLSFAAGETQQTITIDITNDTLDETDETFSVKLSNAQNAVITDSEATGIITDNDVPPNLSIDDVTINEDGTATFTVTLDAASAKEITVDFETGDGSAIAGQDYTAKNGTLTFSAGQTEQMITVNLNNDSLDEVDETFSVKLSNAKNAVITDNQATGTITDNDEQPNLSIGDVTVNEADGTATFTVSLDAASSKEITVDFATVDADALSGQDYTASTGTLTFAAGETEKTITVDINDDTLDEVDESFKVVLSNAKNASIAKAESTNTIIDNDPEPNLSIADVTVDETAGTATFTATLDAASAKEISVGFAIADGEAIAGTDYVATTGRLTFAAGETEKTITVDISDDLIYEGVETFKLNLLNATHATITDAEAVGTITDNESKPEIRIRNLKMQEGDKGTTTAVFNLKLSGTSSETISVDYATDNSHAKAGSDYKATNGTLTFAPGETEKTISVEVIGDRAYEKREGFFVHLSNVENASIGKPQGKVVITDNDPRPTLSVADVALQEGNRGKTQANFVLTLEGKTDVKTLVEYKTVDGKAKAGGDYVATTGQVTFHPGQTEKVVSVGVVGDLKVENDESFQIEITRATAADVVKGKATATIRNDDRSLRRGQEVDMLVGAPVAIAPERDVLTAPVVSDLFECELSQPELQVDSSHLMQLSSGSMGDTGLFGIDPLLSTSLGQGDSVLMAASQALI